MFKRYGETLEELETLKQQLVRKPLAHDDLRLADGRARQPGAGAGRKLPARDLRRLVRLDVGPQLARSRGEIVGHAPDVALHRRDVDNERGRRDLVQLHDNASVLAQPHACRI